MYSFILIRYGTARAGTVLHGTARYCTVPTRCCTVRHGTTRYGKVCNNNTVLFLGHLQYVGGRGPLGFLAFWLPTPYRSSEHPPQLLVASHGTKPSEQSEPAVLAELYCCMSASVRNIIILAAWRRMSCIRVSPTSIYIYRCVCSSH